MKLELYDRLWETLSIVSQKNAAKMKLNDQKLIDVIDYCTEYTGRLSAWLVLALVLLISYDVTMRYAFQQGSVALQELEWHLFALIFLLGGAYTLKHDEHVKVDVIYNSRFVSEKLRCWIFILGTLLFLFPFCILIISSSWPFVENSFYYNESSPDPGGLPYRFILKGAIIVGFGLIMLQALAELLRRFQVLRQLEAK